MLSLTGKSAPRLAAVASCCFALALACAGAAAQTSYGIVDLGTLPGGTSSTGVGLNNNGRAVGSATLPTSQRAVVANPDNAGVSNSMDVKLRNVLNAMSHPNKETACQHLSAFDKEIDAQDGKHLATGDAVVLRFKVAQLSALLGCN